MSLMSLIAIHDGSNYSNIFDGIIRAETYKIIPSARQDVDSYRDANGLLHRNTVEHTATSIQFNTIVLKEPKMVELMHFLNSHADKPEWKFKIKYYNPLKGQPYYKGSGASKVINEAAFDTGDFYLGANHPVWEVYGTYNDEIFYKETEFKFIEY